MEYENEKAPKKIHIASMKVKNRIFSFSSKMT